MLRGPCLSLVIVAGLAFATPARADGPDASAAAEDLFQRGKALVQKGNYAEACPLLAESQRLDPSGGTLQNLAACYELSGKWASAAARFEELRVVSKSATPPRLDRVRLAEEHLAKVRPKVAHVIIAVPEAIAAKAEVEIDAVRYLPASWSTGIAIDPGSHALVVTATGKQPYKGTITVGNDASEQRVVVPALEDVPAPKVAPPKEDTAAREREQRERAEAEQSRRRLGYIVGGAGAGVLVAGGVFAVLAAMKNADGKDICHIAPNGGFTDFTPEGECIRNSGAHTRANEAKDTALVFANVANVLVPLGAVGLAAGAYLLFFRSSVRASATLGGGVIEGTF